jgi:hypothetical protein
MDIKAKRKWKRQNVTILLSSTIIKYHKVEKSVWGEVSMSACGYLPHIVNLVHFGVEALH